MCTSIYFSICVLSIADMLWRFCPRSNPDSNPFSCQVTIQPQNKINRQVWLTKKEKYTLWFGNTKLTINTNSSNRIRPTSGFVILGRVCLENKWTCGIPLSRSPLTHQIQWSAWVGPLPAIKECLTSSSIMHYQHYHLVTKRSQKK